MEIAQAQSHLMQQIAAQPGIKSVTTLHAYGYTACRYGHALTLLHGQTILTQTITRHRSAPPLPTGRLATPPSFPQLPETGRTPTAFIEQLLAAAHTGLPIRHLDLYSTRPRPPVVTYGLTATYEDGTFTFTHLRHTLRVGEHPSPSTLFRPLHEL